MHQITMLLGLKFHVFTPNSDAFSRFWAHLCKTEFLYSMQTWKELCDKMAISWLKVAKTCANWRLSCHMQGFQQAIRRGIPFPQTIANFPSYVLILSLKRSPTFRLCRYSVGNYRTSPAASVPPLNFYWTHFIGCENFPQADTSFVNVDVNGIV